MPSNEGLILALDTSLLFRLDKEKAAFVYQTVGDNYAEKIVEPTLRAAIRASTSAHSANALYTNARELVQQQIQDELRTQLAPRDKLHAIAGFRCLIRLGFRSGMWGGKT